VATFEVVPETRYVRTPDGVFIAYQVVGSGPAAFLVGMHAEESNVDLIWDEPDWGSFLRTPLAYGRVIIHDRRGLGVSSRNVEPPDLETQVSDVVAVLDAADVDRVIVTSGSTSAAVLVLLAATHPERVAGFVWNNPRARTAWAPDYPWGMSREEFEAELALTLQWGTAPYGQWVAQFREAERLGIPTDSLAGATFDPRRVNDYAKVTRNSSTPDVAERFVRNDWETDLRAVLPAVQAPTILLTGTRDQPDEAEYIASLMPNATLRVVEGRSGTNVAAFDEALRQVAGVSVSPVGSDTVLATVLFTDIVDSTKTQAELGDRAWKVLVERHHAIVRSALARWHGLENDTAGDGFYAQFDGPARAVRCAREIVELVRPLGIEVRAGIHTGECEVIDGKCGGLSVTIGARIANLAGASQVLVSQTVKDLVAGSGLAFTEVGERQLKGVPGTWHVLELVPS
jgi:class 3 adenylate cyclase/pimeloyl-ACP methyl ester carboxylesterase